MKKYGNKYSLKRLLEEETQPSLSRFEKLKAKSTKGNSPSKVGKFVAQKLVADKDEYSNQTQVYADIKDLEVNKQRIATNDFNSGKDTQLVQDMETLANQRIPATADYFKGLERWAGIDQDDWDGPVTQGQNNTKYSGNHQFTDYIQKGLKNQFASNDEFQKLKKFSSPERQLNHGDFAVLDSSDQQYSLLNQWLKDTSGKEHLKPGYSPAELIVGEDFTIKNNKTYTPINAAGNGESIQVFEIMNDIIDVGKSNGADFAEQLAASIMGGHEVGGTGFSYDATDLNGTHFECKLLSGGQSARLGVSGAVTGARYLQRWRGFVEDLYSAKQTIDEGESKFGDNDLYKTLKDAVGTALSESFGEGTPDITTLRRRAGSGELTTGNAQRFASAMAKLETSLIACKLSAEELEAWTELGQRQKAEFFDSIKNRVRRAGSDESLIQTAQAQRRYRGRQQSWSNQAAAAGIDPRTERIPDPTEEDLDALVQSRANAENPPTGQAMSDERNAAFQSKVAQNRLTEEEVAFNSDLIKLVCDVEGDILGHAFFADVAESDDAEAARAAHIGALMLLKKDGIAQYIVDYCEGNLYGEDEKPDKAMAGFVFVIPGGGGKDPRKAGTKVYIISKDSLAVEARAGRLTLPGFTQGTPKIKYAPGNTAENLWHRGGIISETHSVFDGTAKGGTMEDWINWAIDGKKK